MRYPCGCETQGGLLLRACGDGRSLKAALEFAADRSEAEFVTASRAYSAHFYSDGVLPEVREPEQAMSA